MSANPLTVIERLCRWSYSPGEDHPWWADNVAHFTGGVLIGIPAFYLTGDIVLTGIIFLAVAAVWEYYEYRYEIRPWDPREDWSMDRAVEDTLLDTYIGLTGAVAAAYVLSLL